MNAIHAFDIRLTKLIGQIPKGLQAYFSVLGYATTPLVWGFFTAALVVYNLWNGKTSLTPLLILCLVPLATIIKLLIRRKRPMTIYAEAMKVRSYSFPSSHAYSSALAGGYFTSLASGGGTYGMSIAFTLFILVIGVSRIHLGAHYPSDVIAGWILGISLLFVSGNL